jgi:hypothetical protein
VPATGAAGTGTGTPTGPTRGAGNVQFSAQATTDMTNGLAGFRITDLNHVRGVTNLTGTWNAGQINGLIQAMNNNPQARQTADILSDRLRQDRRIGPNQRVVGLHDATVYVIGQ